jgi:hypothetical protein
MGSHSNSPVSSSPEAVGTHPSEVVRRPPPLLIFSKKRSVRVERWKTVKALIDLSCTRLGGSTAKNQNSNRKNTQNTPRCKTDSSIEHVKDLGGVQVLHRGLGGYTQRVRSCAPIEKSYDAMTLVHEPLSLCASDPHSSKGSGATVGTNSIGVPTING